MASFPPKLAKSLEKYYYHNKGRIGKQVSFPEEFFLSLKIRRGQMKNASQFTEKQVEKIRKAVGQDKALVALSGGVDSSVTTLLAHRAIGQQLRVVLIDHGLMRKGEPQAVKNIFAELKLGIRVWIMPRQKIFFQSLKGKTDGEQKRKAIRDTFYRKVLPEICENHQVKYLFQGTNKTDIEETQKGFKTQHNVLSQIGLNPQKYGLPPIIEPLKDLRKDEIREVAKVLGLPEEISQRMPFPGPALAIRIDGEVTPGKVRLIRKATQIVEEEFAHWVRGESDKWKKLGLETYLPENAKPNPFQVLAFLPEFKATGIKNGKRLLGNVIIIRAVDSLDARIATPTQLPDWLQKKLSERITAEIPSVVQVLYSITPKPPATIEFI